MLFLCVVTYVFIHFLLYIFYARKTNFMRTEKGIFLYHFLSFCVVTLVSFFYLLKNDSGDLILLEIAVVSIHGIYSLTFLEFWSLSQGGYSISILNMSPIKHNDQIILQQLQEIGDKKFNDRLAALVEIKMLKQEGDLLIATQKGYYFTLLLKFFVFLTNRKEVG